MTYWLSEPIESLFRNQAFQPGTMSIEAPHENIVELDEDIDYLVVGSGYGAAMAALALIERTDASGNNRPKVWILERGDEYLPGDFPKTVDDIPPYMNYVGDTEYVDGMSNIQNRMGLWEIRSGNGVSVLSGSGLGGTSLVNANVAARPASETLQQWPAQDFGAATWSELLEQVYDKIEAVLGVELTADAEAFDKYQALKDTVTCMGGTTEHARLSIDFKADGRHSASTKPCNLCGNCVIGCHNGSKQSLNINVWPLVKQIGGDAVRLYTGVTTRSLQIVGAGDSTWMVECELTRSAGKQFIINAKNVILAAGTQGSVEILKRSEIKRGLSLSARLGKQFSTNGDALISSVGQSASVNATCDIPGRDVTPGEGPGPTIIGKGRISLDAENPGPYFTLEDGAIPYPLLPLWQEILVTQSFLNRYADGRLSAWHENNPAHDYLAVSDKLNRNSQVLLAMGDDGALGEVSYDEENDKATPQWPDREDGAPPDYFEILDVRLKSAEENCFDGGQYFPNPLWQPIPPGFSTYVQGADNLPTMLLSVHPLGGCCIGADATAGVVNTRGQVFSDNLGNAVYGNLFVLDGSIIPGAVGTNPFMTIAAASYRLAYEIADPAFPNKPALDANFPDLTDFQLVPNKSVNAMPTDPETEVKGVFTERLVHYIGKKTLLPWSIESDLTIDDINSILNTEHRFPSSTDSLVLEIQFDFTGDNHLEKWIQNPSMPLAASAILYYDSMGSVSTVTSAHLVEFARLNGTVSLSQREDIGFFRLVARLWKVFQRFRRFRKHEVSIWQTIQDVLKSLFSWDWSILRVPRIHTDFRTMEYSFTEPADDVAIALGLKFHGLKTIAYSNDYLNLWGSLLTMEGRLESSGTGQNLEIGINWEIDAVDITKGAAPLQIRDSLDLLQALSRVGGVIAYFLRFFLQTHFWSFGAPEYDEYRTKEDIDSKLGVDPPLPLELSRLYDPPAVIRFGENKQEETWPMVPVVHPGDDDETQTCRLIRYQPLRADGAFDINARKTLFLIHGLAHGSRIFWTDTISDHDERENLVQFFLARNYDVWILDHRTSPNYVKRVTSDHKWDEIAENDIPWAVNHIFDAINPGNPVARKKIHVFSHCIGAGAVSMSVLSGQLNYHNALGQQESMLASLVPHAVAPWLFASMANRARSNVWSFFKDLEPLDVVEPCPHHSTGLIENLMDRIGTSTLTEYENSQWDQGDNEYDARGPMFPRTIYTRYTIIWGRQWVNENINRATHNQFAGMIGAVPRDILQQVYSSIIRGLLSNHDGNNIYVTKSNIDTHWTFPTLFVHGDMNTVFDIETSKKSAEMLTRHRREHRLGTHILQDIEPQDYCENDIWIETFSGYGHMDMILGENAYDEIFPSLDEFFVAADEDRIDDKYKDEFTTPEEKLDFKSSRGAVSHIGPIKRPVTGPIISHPRINGFGKLELNIWVEAQDFTSIPVNRIYVEGDVAPSIGGLFLMATAHKSAGPFHPASPAKPSGPRILTLDPYPLHDARSLPSFELAKDIFWLVTFSVDTGRSIRTNPVIGPVPADAGITPLGITADPRLVTDPVVDPLGLVDPGPAPTDTTVAGIDPQGPDDPIATPQENTDTGVVDGLAEDPGNLASLASEVVYLWVDYTGTVSRPPSAVKMKWRGLDWFERLANPASVNAGDPELSFAVSSCLYPGTAIDREQMSQVFTGIYTHVERDIPPGAPENYRRGVDHIMFLGDQIYADATANIMDPITGYEKYRNRYRKAWSNPPAHKLFSHVPTYFAVDDHEYNDNYQGVANDPLDFTYAVNMAWQFQMHDDINRTSAEPRLWYNFDSAGARFFVFDTRMQRTSADATKRNNDTDSLLSNPQLDDFRTWLTSPQTQALDVIFIASGSPIVPITKAQQKEPLLLQGEDNLLGYPAFLIAVADLLATNAAGKYVCWLAGDPHISCYANLELETETHNVKLTHICSSGAYTPLSFINTKVNNCDWSDGAGGRETLVVDKDRLTVHYEQYIITDHHQHFMRIDLNRGPANVPILKLSVFDASGNELTNDSFPAAVNLQIPSTQ
jgi:cholesterol oxidase